MNFVVSKKKPEIGDRGFIVGDRFIPIQNDSKDSWYVSNNLVSLITADSFQVDNITNQQTIKNVSSLNFDGIDDYLISKYNFSNLSEFTFAIKFKAFSNGYLVGINQEGFPPTSLSNSWCPIICIVDRGFEFRVWNGNGDSIFSYSEEDIKNKWNVLIGCKNQNIWKVYLNGSCLGESSGGISFYWARQYSLGCGFDSLGDRPSVGNGNWHHINCQIRYAALYNKFLTDEEVSNFS